MYYICVPQFSTDYFGQSKIAKKGVSSNEKFVSDAASLLLPALRNAREAAYRVSCSSNLRQCSVAVLAYAYDNDDWFPGQHGNLATRFMVAAEATLLWEEYFNTAAGETLASVICPATDAWDQIAERTRHFTPSTYYAFVIGQGYGSGSSAPWYGWRHGAAYPDSTATPLPNLGMINNTPIPHPAAKQPIIGEVFNNNGTVLIPGTVNADRGHDEGTNTVFADGHVQWSSGREEVDFTDKIQFWGGAMRWSM